MVERDRERETDKKRPETAACMYYWSCEKLDKSEETKGLVYSHTVHGKKISHGKEENQQQTQPGYDIAISVPPPPP